MMVETFDAIGLGQWFRYLTGLIEVGGAVLLWVPRRQAWGAALLGATMIGAVLANLVVLGAPRTTKLARTAPIMVAPSSAAPHA